MTQLSGISTSDSYSGPTIYAIPHVRYPDCGMVCLSETVESVDLRLE